jgi:cell division protease FtsH
MPDETPDSENSAPKQKRPPKTPGGQEPQFNWRGLLLLAIAFALIGGAFLFRGTSIASTEEITLPKFESLLKEGKIISTAEKPLELVIEEGRNTQFLSGFYRKKTTGATEELPTPFKTSVYMPFNGTTLEKELASAGITPNVRSESNMLASTLLNVLPILLLFGFVYLFFRSQIKMAGKGAMSFGKSKAKMLAREKNKITFKDVAGVEEAKEEVL